MIFDCDGVLIDSEILSASVLIGLLDPLGMQVDQDYVRRNFLGRSFPTVAARLREEFGLDLPVDFEATYRSELLQQFEGGLKTTPGVTDVLNRLDAKKCVATSSSPERARRSLAIAGLDGFFGDAIFTASAVERGKPAPDLFLHAAGAMGAEPADCLVIEDSRPGIAAAKAAKMPVLRYMGGSHFSMSAAEAMAADPSIAAFDSWEDFFSVAVQAMQTKETVHGSKR